MSAEENMALVRRFWEARAKGDLEAMDAMMAPNFVTHTKTLSENFPVSLEQRRIPPRMGLSLPPFSKGDASYGRGYHNAENGLLPDAETIVEETQEIPAQAKEERKRQRWQAQSL